jgi:hypothetical protein
MYALYFHRNDHQILNCDFIGLYVEIFSFLCM